MQLSVNKRYKYCLILHIVNMFVAGDCQVRFREWIRCNSPAYSIFCCLQVQQVDGVGDEVPQVVRRQPFLEARGKRSGFGGRRACSSPVIQTVMCGRKGISGFYRADS